MAYFKTIKTSGTDVDTVVSEHNQKLNNYQRYGRDLTDTGYSALADVFKHDGFQEPEVCNQSSTMMLKNFDTILTTILCCEDEKKEEEKES